MSGDTDFGTLLAISGRTSPSVILFRSRKALTANQHAELILSHLDDLTPDLLDGAVVVVSGERIRIRRLPLRPDNRWRLTDPCVQQAWVEVLGPTATLLARRFGRIIEDCPDGLAVDCGDVPGVTGVQPNVFLRALERWHERTRPFCR